MEFYLENSYFNLNPYLRIGLKTIKKTFDILFFLFTLIIFLLILLSKAALNEKIKILSGLLSLLIIEFSLIYLRKRGKEDLRNYTKKRINLINFLNASSLEIVINTLSLAEIKKVKNFNLLFLLELCYSKSIKKTLKRLEAENITKEIKIETAKEDFDPLKGKKIYYDSLFLILKKSYEKALSLNFPYINEQILFLGLTSLEDPEITKILEKFDIDKEDVLVATTQEIFKSRRVNINLYQPLSTFQKGIENKRFFTSFILYKPTPKLDAYGIDLTLLACKQGIGFLIGHKEEVKRLIALLRSLKTNILLVGEEGSGRETIIYHLAWLIHNDLVPQEISDYRLVKLDLSLLYSENRENFLSKLTEIIKEVVNAKKIILFFPEIHQVILEPYLNVMQILNPVLTSKEIIIIASTTSLGYLQMNQKINIDSFFEKIEINEPSIEESILLLTLKSILWEKMNKIKISSKAITKAVVLAKNFLKQKPLPKSAEDLLTQAINIVKSEGGNFISQELIQEIVASLTKIPIQKLSEEEKEKILNLENLLHQRIVNQEEAIKEIARVLKIYRAGLEKKKGPIGVFLFVGPTGVGKTETAKALAKIYYGSEENMVRLDMVEFQNPEDLDKLIGSKDGKILGLLTEPLRQNPYSLILLDEFEKTHPTILKIFLPIFDEGLIKDGLGRDVDFRHSLIICTSNAYSEEIKKAIENNLPFEEITENIKSKLTPIFSVELINRFDNVIVYKPLGFNELFKIAQIMLNDLKTEVLLKHGIDMEIDNLAIEELVKRGTDPIFGARPLKRKIDELIKNKLADLILQEKIRRGDKLKITYNNDFEFQILEYN